MLHCRFSFTNGSHGRTSVVASKRTVALFVLVNLVMMMFVRNGMNMMASIPTMRVFAIANESSCSKHGDDRVMIGLLACCLWL